MQEFIVVGGGVIGMLTARELDLAGASVTLIERHRTGRESSWAGGGILSPLHPWRCDDAITRLARWSQERYPQLAGELRQATGIDPEWTRCGFLILNESDHRTACAWARRFDYTINAVARDELCAIEPSLADQSATALWMPDIAQIRNPRLLSAIRQDLRRRGVRILEQRTVLGILHRHERALGVQTDRGPVRAGAVIVAAGAWTGQLLEALGDTPAIAPVRGQMILFRAQPGLLSGIVLDADRYLIPRRDGRILAGSTRENAGFVKQTTQSAHDELRSAALRLAPDLAEFPVEHHWAGLRPGSPRGIPYIGKHPRISNLYVNSGHFRNGLVLAPASTRLLADLALGRDPILPPQPYALTAPR